MIHNNHITQVLDTRNHRFLCNVSEFIEGRSLAQWIEDQVLFWQYLSALLLLGLPGA